MKQVILIDILDNIKEFLTENKISFDIISDKIAHGQLCVDFKINNRTHRLTIMGDEKISYGIWLDDYYDYQGVFSLNDFKNQIINLH